MKVRLLLFVTLLGFLPASSFGASPKSRPAAVAKPHPPPSQVTKSPAKPAAATVNKATPAAKPAPVAKKPSFSVKSLFSRKTAPAEVVKVTPAAPAPAKRTVTVKSKPSKPVPVIVRDTSEFVDISFPEPRKEKSPVVAEGGAKAR